MSEREVVTTESEGYYDNSVVTQIDGPSEENTEATNYVEISIDDYDNVADHMTPKEIIIDATGGAKITIPASIEYVDGSGNILDGNFTTEAAYINVTTEAGREVFSGEYEGKIFYDSIVLFASYGAVSEELQMTAATNWTCPELPLSHFHHSAWLRKLLSLYGIMTMIRDYGSKRAKRSCRKMVLSRVKNITFGNLKPE